MRGRDGPRANVHPGRRVRKNVIQHPPTGNVQYRVNTTKLTRGTTRKLFISMIDCISGHDDVRDVPYFFSFSFKDDPLIQFYEI